MNNQSIQEDLNKYLDEKMAPFYQQALEQERQRHQKFLDKHFKDYEAVGHKHDSYIAQLITLEGAIFGALIIFTDSKQITGWILSALCLILISIIFGIFRQGMAIQAIYDSLELEYSHEMKSHWSSRELWKDETLAWEKKLVGENTFDQEPSYKKRFAFKLLKFFRLNADRIENIFLSTFVIALILLIINLIVIFFS